MVVYADGITPSGVQNGINQTYTLPNAPNPAASLKYYYNGVLMSQGVDYILVGSTVTYVVYKPASTDVQVAFYRYQV
jgi:hypothetical protein